MIIYLQASVGSNQAPINLKDQKTSIGPTNQLATRQPRHCSGFDTQIFNQLNHYMCRGYISNITGDPDLRVVRGMLVRRRVLKLPGACIAERLVWPRNLRLGFQ